MWGNNGFTSGIVALGLAVQLGVPLPPDGPIAYLGSTFDTSPCQVEKLKVGQGTTALCGTWSAIMTKDEVVRVISLSSAYEGKLPKNLSWGEPHQPSRQVAWRTQTHHRHVRDANHGLHV